MKTLLAIIFLLGYIPAFSQSEITVSGIEFVLIPTGTYTYGKFHPPYPEYDSSRIAFTSKDYRCAKKLAKRDALDGFEVAISKSFYISKFEITQEQWKKVMKSNPSFFKGDSLPVDNVTWKSANAFTAALGKLDGKTRFRLPTEFEWEYAARAGATDDISWEEIREQAQIGTLTTNNVGGKKPNAWGLYDMLGNVWEWTSDLYNEKIFADKYPAAGFSEHVLKGASFVGDVKNATYMTHAGGPGNGWDIGFRIVIDESGAANIPAKSKPLKHEFKDWHISRTTHQGTTPNVKINNGVITISQHPYGQGGVLLTNKKYRNFDLSVEVKIDSFCNSGIFLRSSESGQAYQVELSEPGGTGNLFGEMMRISKPAEAGKKAEVWKPGDWNLFRVTMTGEVPTITLWINGALMWEVTEPQNDFTAGAVEGMIGLQSHWTATYSASSKAFDMSGSWKPGAEIKFRNFTIKEL
jgi:formylglycine-generating enzyme required for sulfatase activity